jgi:hypothetical protein
MFILDIENSISVYYINIIIPKNQMRKFNFILNTLFLLCVNTYSQVVPEWIRFFNNENNTDDNGRYVLLDETKNIIIVGSAGDKMIVMKYSPDGNLLWEKREFNIVGRCAEIDSLNNIYVLGVDNLSDCRIVKYSPSGQQIWNTFYNTPTSHYPRDIEIDRALNIFVFSGGDGCSLAKFNLNGNFLWQSRYYGTGSFSSGDGYNKGMKIDNYGNIYVNQTINRGVPTNHDIVTIKYNTNGDSLWVRPYNYINAGYDGGGSIALDEFSGVYIGGYSSLGAYQYLGHILKYNSDGMLIWQDSIHGLDGGSYSLKCKNGYLYAAGDFYHTSNGWGPISKYTYNGNLLWTTYSQVPGAPNFHLRFVEIDENGYIYCGGNINYSQNNNDICAIKYNSSGIQQWSLVYDGGMNFNDGGNSMVLDNNKLIFTGEAYRQNNMHDVILIKYSANPIGIIKIGETTPNKFNIKQNYPNPFNPVTNIEFGIPNSINVNIQIYDISGRIIEMILNKYLIAGEYKIDYNAQNLSSGIYFYRLTAGSFSETKKMMLVK